MKDQIEFVYAAGVTRRFHTMPVLRHQNIADHSWHVAMLAHVLYGQEEPGITPAFLMACLTHDMAECKIGDIPAPAKREMDDRYTLVDERPLDEAGAHSFRDAWGILEQEIQSKFAMDWEKFLSEEEKRRLKLCDAFEGAMYCVTERAMGNTRITPAFHNFSRYVAQLLHDVPTEVPLEDRELTLPEREWKFYDYIADKWREANGEG